MAIYPENLVPPLLGQSSAANALASGLGVLSIIIFAVFWLLVWVGSVGGLIGLTHYLLTLPMRRMERARLFLDLIETALQRGQPVEEMIVSVSQSREQTVGVRFHVLAAHVESGLSLGAALEKVPRFLPPQISAMLRAGEQLGDLNRVLPACREILRDRPAAVRSAMHYMLLLILFFSPSAVMGVFAVMVFVVPRFRDVAAGTNAAVPFLTQFVFDHSVALGVFEIILFLALVATAAVYIGGPRFVRWVQFHGLPFADWIAWRIPWKQKRLQRTFSAMLAVLLDGGVPEAVAVRLAGDCTANEIGHRRAQRVMAALERGTKLDDAIREFDDGGEFRWRLANAIPRSGTRGGFLNALRGWHEVLDARAFQQEEAAAHTVTTGLVILNGLLVALIATATFGMLVAILKAMLSTL